MLFQTSLVLSVASLISAELIPEVFERTVRSSGGWSLSQGEAPPGLDGCGSAWFCPPSTTCNHLGGEDIANVCCSGTIDCYEAFKAGPFCADDSWGLWKSTDGQYTRSSFFCCLPGQVGMQNGDCVTPDLISSPDQLADNLSPGSGSSGVPSSSIISKTTTVGHSSTTAVVITTTSATRSVAPTTTEDIATTTEDVATTSAAASTETSEVAEPTTTSLPSTTAKLPPTKSVTPSPSPSFVQTDGGMSLRAFGNLAVVNVAVMVVLGFVVL